MNASSRVGALVTVGLHATALFAVLAYAPARSAIQAVTPIMADWIAAPKAALTPAAAEPPKPKPVVKRPVPRPALKPPIEPSAAKAPSPIVAAAPLPPPEPSATAAPAPVAVMPPVFDATYLQNPAPAYPTLSRRMKEEGRVVLRVLVSANGAADEVQLRASSGYARLDDTARDTVKHWRFVPAKRGLQPVAEWVLIPISFKLEG
jgi:protein TonB